MSNVKAWTIILTVAILSMIARPELGVADVVINGNFETGDFTGWQTTGNVLINSEQALIDNAGGFGQFPSGDFVAAFGPGNRPNDGVMWQDLATNSGAAYDLSLDYGAFGSTNNPQSVTLSVVDVTSGQILLSESLVAPTPTFNLGTIFSSFNYNFSAIGNETRITFSDTSTVTFRLDGMVDNISVSQVPEPSGLVCYLTILTGYVLRNRGRKFR